MEDALRCLREQFEADKKRSEEKFSQEKIKLSTLLHEQEERAMIELEDLKEDFNTQILSMQ